MTRNFPVYQIPNPSDQIPRVPKPQPIRPSYHSHQLKQHNKNLVTCKDPDASHSTIFVIYFNTKKKFYLLLKLSLNKHLETNSKFPVYQPQKFARSNLITTIYANDTN